MGSPKADSAHSADQPDKPVADIPPEARLKEAAAAAENALAAQSMANSLKKAASSFTDPKKREQMLADAYNKEIEAHGSSKKARMLQSGAFQGTMGGAGIGGAVGVGVGTVVGTVVGGLTAIPTTGLGALVGTGVGAIHGPFIKLGSLATGMGKGEKEGSNKEGEQEGKEGKQEAQGSPDDDDAVPDPEALRQAADVLAQEKEKQRQDTESSQKEEKARGAGKKKPRKIEIRSGRQPENT